MHRFTTSSARETEKMAARLASLLEAGDNILLVGGLGAGKTCFARGLAEGLGIKEAFSSPSFVIMKEYRGRLPLYHLDLYRLDEKQAIELGLEEYFSSNGITLVEWGERLGSAMPLSSLKITIKPNWDGSERSFKVEPQGEGWKEKIKKWLV